MCIGGYVRVYRRVYEEKGPPAPLPVATPPRALMTFFTGRDVMIFRVVSLNFTLSSEGWGETSITPG